MCLPDPQPYAGTSEELFTLANAIAAVVEGAVTVEDLERRVLAYSTLPDQPIDDVRRVAILGRQVPRDQDIVAAQYHHILHGDGVVRLAVLDDRELPRVAVAIRAGDRPLGTIWAIEGPHPIDKDQERALLDGARLAAVHILRQRSSRELGIQAREDALRRILTGVPTTDEARFHLGLSSRPTLKLLGVALAQTPGGASALEARLGESTARHWAALHPEASTAAIGRVVYVLVPGEQHGAVARLAAQSGVALGRTFGKNVRTAISRATDDPADLARLRSEVDDILRVTTTSPGTPAVADLSQVHAQVLLVHLADELARHPHLAHPGLEAMVEHDRTRNTCYAESVTAWLDAVGNVGEAARSLAVHPNTLKYRLRRARDLFEIDLDDPAERLSCWLQLHLTRAHGL